eukprot:gene9453-32436_t
MPQAPDITAELFVEAPDITAELFVEVLGCLANLFIPEFDFLGLVHKHSLLEFLAQYAQPGAVDDGILLQVVMFVGVLFAVCACNYAS